MKVILFTLVVAVVIYLIIQTLLALIGLINTAVVVISVVLAYYLVKDL